MIEQITKDFFKTIQNKMHYAVSKNTAAEIVWNRVDSTKKNIGLTNFKGNMPTKSETEFAKNYLSLEEYDKYMQNHLTQAEKDYLKIMSMEVQELDK